MKTCTSCKVEKPLTDFSLDRKAMDGKAWECKSCSSDRRKKYYAKNADKERERSKKYRVENADKVRESKKKYYAENSDRARDRNLQNRYGIGHEEYLELFEKQDGKCKICETTSNRKLKHFAVDHCHDTGDVRGLLCSNCNTAIGLLKDNPDLLRTAAKYIEKAYND